MRVIKENDEIIDVPVPVAHGLVSDGRAKPLPGEEWRFPDYETAMIEPPREVRKPRPRGRARTRKKTHVR